MPFQDTYGIRIINLLKKHPAGMTTDGIARSLPLNRTSTAKYLNTLVISGQVEVRKMGPAKIFTLTRRVPVSQMLSVFPEGIIIVDQDHVVRDTNSCFLALGQINREDIVGKKYENATLPDDLKASLLPMIAHPKSVQKPFIIRTADPQGNERYFRVISIPVVFDDGTPGSALILEEVNGLGQNQRINRHEVTSKTRRLPRTKASSRHDNIHYPDNAVQFREGQYRRIFENLPVPFYHSDLEGNILMVNPAGATMAGYASPEDVVGNMTTAEVYANPNDRIQFLAELAREGQVMDYPVTLRSRDGNLRHMATSSRYCTDTWGNIIGIVGVLRDITGQKQREAALQERAERFRSLIEHTGCIFFSMNPGGILTYVSSNMTGMLGYEQGEVIGRSFETFLHPDDLQNAQDYLRDSIAAERSTIRKEYRLQHKNGTWVWYTMNVSVLRNGDGSVLSVQGIAHDITDTKKVENALLRANRQIVLLNSITRHDIVNRITVIRGYIGIVKMKFTDPALLELLQKTESGVETIRSQIEFTKTYQDLGNREPQWHDIAGSLHGLQIPASLTLTTDVAGIEIFADCMLDKVFFNLLDNTLRHGGNVTEIRILARHTGPDLTIVWEDNGIGIPPEEKERIFERGFGKNTGLGLFLVREILALTGITIAETGKPGEGARFEISVPQEMWRQGPAGRDP